jgi:hypothetical protein
MPLHLPPFLDIHEFMFGWLYCGHFMLVVNPLFMLYYHIYVVCPITIIVFIYVMMWCFLLVVYILAFPGCDLRIWFSLVFGCVHCYLS